MVGRGSEQGFEEFSVSFQANHSMDEREYPTHEVSVDVEEIKSTKYDEERMCHGKRMFVMSSVVNGGEPLTAEWGVDWVHIMSFNIHRNKQGLNVMKAPRKIPKAVIDSLRNFPVLVGVNMKDEFEKEMQRL